MEKQRDYRIDLVKACALFFVICVHFFYNGTFYGTPIEGKRMLIMMVMRNLFMSCVPLFIMVSGYLSRHFAWDRKLPVRFLNVWITYLLCGAVCMAFQTVVLHKAAQASMLESVFDRLIHFDAAPYGWYVEMYLGLLLLMPFLNVIVQHTMRSQLRSCVIALGLLTLLPYAVPDYAFFDHWVDLYPVFYYMLGAYIGEYRVMLDTRRKRMASVIALAALAVVWGIFNFSDYRGRNFLWEARNGYNGIVIAISTCLIFLLVHSVPVERMPGLVRRLIRRISGLTLPAFLLSYCFDQIVYPRLNAVFPEAYRQLVFFPGVVLLVFVCSLLSAQGISWCAGLMMKPVRWVFLGKPVDGKE